MALLKRTREKGFTLIELLVVCAIMIVVTAIILANNNKFGGQVQLQNFAYEVALSVRQAQVYGISVQRFGTNDFSAAYGVHFDTTTAANSRMYVLYADANGNGTYDGTFACPQVPSDGSEFVECESIGQNYFVEGLCVNTSLTGSCAPVSTLDVIFIRPEPDAYIDPSCSIVSGAEQCTSSYTSAQITLESPSGDTMSVSVENSGQISVEQQVGSQIGS